MYDITVSFVVAHGAAKSYRYQGSRNVACHRVRWALAKPNCNIVNVDHDDQRVFWHREAGGDTPFKRVVAGVHGSITMVAPASGL